MKRGIAIVGVWLGLCAVEASATDLQGVLVDYACGKDMLRDGRVNTLKHNQNCSLSTEYSRSVYGIITDDKHLFKLDDAGREWALKLLKDTSDKNNLKVIVSGDVKDDTVYVKNMSEL